MASWRNTVFGGLPLLLLLLVGICSPVCVEVPSETEAVQGRNMTLLCISCMQREEVYAVTNVWWYHEPKDNGNQSLIFEYIDGKTKTHEGPFKDRLRWIGSKDLQDVSLVLHNVSMTDSGKFICSVNRTLHFEQHQHETSSKVEIILNVSTIQKDDFTSVLSEIMMYILLAFLTLWLLVEVVYCYRKISKAEEVTQESVTDYLAIPSENKESCPVPVEEQ